MPKTSKRTNRNKDTMSDKQVAIRKKDTSSSKSNDDIPYLNETDFSMIPIRCNVAPLNDIEIDGIKSWKLCEHRSRAWVSVILTLKLIRKAVYLATSKHVPGGYIYAHPPPLNGNGEWMFFLTSGARFEPEGTKVEKMCKLLQKSKNLPVITFGFPTSSQLSIEAHPTSSRKRASESEEQTPAKAKKLLKASRIVDNEPDTTHLPAYDIPLHEDHCYVELKNVSMQNKCFLNFCRKLEF
jgi:hypothetical protein